MNAAGTVTRPSLPSVSTGSLARTMTAGAVGLVVWEAFARLLAPIWLGGPLDPTGLIEAAFGISGIPAQILHLLTGLLFFPLGYVFVVRPLATWIAQGLPWSVLGLGYGVALWVFAMYGMASLMGGMPPFLGFEPVAWVSLVGHIGLGLGIAAATAMLDRRIR